MSAYNTNTSKTKAPDPVRSKIKATFCATCLSRDRRMFSIQGLNLDEFCADIPLSEDEDRVCWECKAVVVKMNDFRHKALKAQAVIENMIRRKKCDTFVHNLSELKIVNNTDNIIIGYEVDSNPDQSQSKQIQEHQDIEPEHQDIEQEQLIAVEISKKEIEFNEYDNDNPLSPDLEFLNADSYVDEDDTTLVEMKGKHRKRKSRKDVSYSDPDNCSFEDLEGSTSDAPAPEAPAMSSLPRIYPEDPPSTAICDLRLLLSGSLEGEALLNRDKSLPLNNVLRNSLVKIIATHLLRQKLDLVKSSYFKPWANEISRFFPKEKPSVYYNVYPVDYKGNFIKRIGGKLPNQFNNLKRKYKDCGLVSKRRRMSSSEVSQTSSRLLDADEEGAKDKLLWLETSCKPWSVVEQKWEETIQTRLAASNELSVTEYFDKYMALKTPKGYLLLQKDFEHLYRGKYREITETFPALKTKIFELAKTTRKSSSNVDLLDYEQSAEETSNIACLLLIPSLMDVTNVHLKNNARKIWRPTKAEVSAGFILQIENTAKIRSAIKNKQKKLEEYGLEMQPFIIIVGESLEDINKYFVVINEVYYAVPNILDAVSLCFKMFWVVNAHYPIECRNTWTIIQKAFFQMKTKVDTSSSSSMALLCELGVDTDNIDELN